MFKCEYCNKSFKRESTIFKHMCEKKRRAFAKDDRDVKAGYTAFVYWYNRSYGNTHSKKSYTDFMNSSFYKQFVTFGKYITESKITEWERYLDWLIKNSVKLNDWSKDSVYYKFFYEIIKTETPERALERYIIFMQSWEEQSGKSWKTFWDNENIFAIVNYIKEGKISPWILFSSDSAMEFIQDLPDELLVEVDGSIDLAYWNNKIKRNKGDMEWIKTLLG